MTVKVTENMMHLEANVIKENRTRRRKYATIQFLHKKLIKRGDCQKFFAFFSKFQTQLQIFTVLLILLGIANSYCFTNSYRNCNLLFNAIKQVFCIQTCKEEML